MADLLSQSWQKSEELEELAKMHRNREIVLGAVKETRHVNMPVKQSNGEMKSTEVEVAVFELQNTVKAYCPATEFSEHEFRSLVGFVGSFQEFIIQRLDLDNKVAVVSVKEADEVKREQFWNHLEEIKEQDELSNTVYEGRISGVNTRNNNIFVRINGADCYMRPQDWDHGRYRLGDLPDIAQRGDVIPVRILDAVRSEGRIRVSRKAAIEDPFTKLEEMQKADAVAGKITEVHPIHGIFVKLDNGLEVKGLKPRHIEEPIVGDIVTCKIREINLEKRHCKVVIINYPQGKKARKDVGSFLFE